MEIQTGPGLSPWKPGEPDPEEVRRARRHDALMFGVRYGVPGLIFLAGVVVFAVVGDREEAARVYFDEHGRWPDENA